MDPADDVLQLATAPREVGRPRIFSDEAIFGGVYLVLRRDGYPALTLEAVAIEVGCTRQALVRRFGSKRSLLLAALDAAAVTIDSGYEQARISVDSPLAALRARFIQPANSRPELGTDPRPQANTLAYILTTSSDPAFGMRFASLVRVALGAMERLLVAAMEQGELAEVDVAALAQTLHVVSAGETVNWCTDQSVPYADTLGAMFDQIIGPYRLPQA